MTDFVYRDRSRLTPYMLYQIERLNDDFKAVWGCEIKVVSGIRTHQEQINIFLQRYVTAANINGRKVYDTRVWNGTRYYRISAAGTVAVPGYSNHEIQGTDGAVDLRDTGSNAGVAVTGSARSNWLKENCSKYDMVAEGFAFGEAWHYKMRNIFAAVPSGGGDITPPKKGIQVKHYHYEDGTCKSAGNRLVAPGGGFWLHTTDKVATSQASNIVGGVGPYTITLHVYATGTPGDVVDVKLVWDDTMTSGPHSGHYVERFVVDKDGFIYGNVTFQRQVTAGYAVYANFLAPKSNKGPVKVTRYDSDAYLFV